MKIKKSRSKRLTALNKRIEESNQAFEKASKAEKRVMIAQDCIERIKMSQLSALQGYVVTDGIYNAENNEILDLSIKDVLSSIIQFEGVSICNTCAKGGLFMSYVGRVNDFIFCDVENNTGHNSLAMKKLREIFSEKQLILIEAAFEGSQIVNRLSSGENYYLSPSQKEKVEDFWNKHESDNNRLIAICENIITNKGTFKL